MCIFQNVTRCKLNEETFKVLLYSIFYKSSTDWQWNQIQPYTTKSIKKVERTKIRPKRNIKMLENGSEKNPYVHVKQKNTTKLEILHQHRGVLRTPWKL